MKRIGITTKDVKVKISKLPSAIISQFEKLQSRDIMHFPIVLIAVLVILVVSVVI